MFVYIIYFDMLAFFLVGFVNDAVFQPALQQMHIYFLPSQLI